MEGEDSVYDLTGRTILNPVGLTVLLVMGVAMIVLPRKFAILPVIVVSSLISPAQRMMIGPANFHFLRILLLFASVRVIARGEFSGIKLLTVDRLVVAFSVIKAIIYTIQYQSVAAFIFQAGQSYDVFGFYFLFRCLVRSFDDVRGFIHSLILVSIPVFIAFLIESRTGTNLFSVLGGIPLITEVRDGKVRCQGAFATSIMAGIYFASSAPLIAARWFDTSQNKLITAIGLFCFVSITLMTNSSTSIMALIFAAVGFCFFPLRTKMRQVRMAILFILILAQCFMSGGVIYLIARINVLGGSTGWHRAYLMDRCIVYFREWALFGTQDTKHWAEGQMGGVGLGDVTNQYIVEGVRGGFITMVLFITIIVLSYRYVGQMLRTREVMGNRSKLIYIYSLGVLMLVHSASFFSVSYFGQCFFLIWQATGIISGLRQTIGETDRKYLQTRQRPRLSPVGRSIR